VPILATKTEIKQEHSVANRGRLYRISDLESKNSKKEGKQYVLFYLYLWHKTVTKLKNILFLNKARKK
jgi:hypothetical protein